MSRRPSTFRQHDLTRALKAAAAAGITVKRIEIEPTGKITIDAVGDGPVEQGSDLDKWMAAHARQA